MKPTRIIWAAREEGPMPIYDYQCVDCQTRDQRVAGLDDSTAICQNCGGLMLRLDDDLFTPYFDQPGPVSPLCPWCGPHPRQQMESSRICAKHAQELRQEVEG